MYPAKALLICLLVFLGVIFGVALAALFLSFEDSEFSDIWKRIFHTDRPKESFSLPQRVRVRSTPETYEEVPSHEEWFSPTSKNVNLHAAVLVAGSKGYQNYRHQADICHAFQVLKAGGLDPDKIITFVYDDIAFNARNPYPGEIYNTPGGGDVYEGCAKDYTGYEVRKDVLFAVLKGDTEAVRGIGSGRVLKPNPEQRVFFAYSDHGSVGHISMPTGSPIYGDQLHVVFQSMVETEAFKEMVVYIEACYAGSLFAGFRSEWKTNMLLVAAADPTESSYATYCPFDDSYEFKSPNATYIGACMGDLFTVAWMEDSEMSDRSEALMNDHLSRVKQRTSNYHTYRSGSHMQTYGDHQGTIGNQVIGNFLSYFSAPSGWTRSSVARLFGLENKHEIKEETISKNYDQWTADLLSLYSLQTQNQGLSEDQEISLEAELKSRREIDHAIKTSLEFLIQIGELPKGSSVQQFAQELIPRPEHLQVVNDWNCLRKMVEVWENHCGNLTDYSRQYTRTFVNLCNALVSPSSFKHSVLHSLC